MKKLLLTVAGLLMCGTSSFAAGVHQDCVNYVGNWTGAPTENHCVRDDDASRSTSRADGFGISVTPAPVHVVEPPDEGGDGGDTPPGDGGGDDDGGTGDSGGDTPPGDGGDKPPGDDTGAPGAAW